MLPPHEFLAALRILDANANRAGEGLRALEEYCRFSLNDAHLARQCKDLRHGLAEAMQAVPQAELLAARDTPADVGTSLTAEQEMARESLRDVVVANGKRVEQALRAIEEYGKLVSGPLAAQIKPLRYQAYTIAKACLSTADSRERLKCALLYVLIDAGASGDDLQRQVTDLVNEGAHILQLRDKKLGDRELLERARIVRRATAGTSTLFLMNDRPDLALLSQADGVHVGQEELGVSEVRQIVGPSMLVGVSTHTIEQARQAVLAGASYIGCGPTFPSQTKQFERFAGMEFLRQVAAEISLPAFAIGGIDSERIDEVLQTGIRRIAVGAAITGAKSPTLAARELLQKLTLTAGADAS